MRNIVFIAGAIFCIVWMFYFSKFHGSLSSENSVWGTFGDFVGGTLNPILSFLGLIALLITINFQIKESEETRTELKNRDKLLELQTRTQKQQQFENTFFELLKQHNDSLNIISSMMRSNNYMNINIDAEIKKALKMPLKDANKHLKEYDYLWGGYFRMLYQLLKFSFVNHPTMHENKTRRDFNDENIKKDDIEFDEKMYTNIIRSFLNHQVTQVLAINCFCENNYNETYIQYKLLLERYSFLEHMPLTYKNEKTEAKALQEVKLFYSDKAFDKNDFIK
jgi:hypothetical protein